jgi:adenylate cyclase
MTGDGTIGVFVADDSLIVREGVCALLAREPDLAVVGVAADYDELSSGIEASVPQVLVVDIRMPPTFQREGIDAAKMVRKRHPGVGVVILSQYDDPEYVTSLIGDGAAGYAYLLKDHVAEGNYLARAVRMVAAGGSMLDPVIVDALVRPVANSGQLTRDEEHLLEMVAEGRPIKSIAAALRTTAAAATEALDRLFMRLAQDASAGVAGALRRLRLLHQAIVAREAHAEMLSRLLPSSVVEKLRQDGWRIGASEKVLVTVLMSDIRGYSTIAERADPTQLAGQLNTHRAEMNAAVLGEGGTIMQFAGDAVIAVFGAPFAQDDHADRALAAARAMQAAQASVNRRWATQGLPGFGLGIGLSTGEAAAALLGSAERLEWTLVGDTVNLAQRLQQWASAGEVVMSQSTHDALRQPVACELLQPAPVKGRDGRVVSYRLRT